MRRLQFFGNRFFDKDDDGDHQDKVIEKSDDKTTGKTYSEDEFKKVVEQRQSLKDKVSEYENKLKEIEDAKNKSKEDKLKEEAKFKELLEAKEKELDSLKPKVEEYEAYITSKRDSIKEKLGDKWLDSFQNLPLTDLEKLAETLVPAKAIETDGGKGKKTETEIVLTKEEKNRAYEMFPFHTKEEAEEAFADIKKNRKTKE